MALRYRHDPRWVDVAGANGIDEVLSVAIDSEDHVYVGWRTLPDAAGVMVFDPNGTRLASWADPGFEHPHGLRVQSDGSLVCTDDRQHTVSGHTPEGSLLWRLGEPGHASDTGRVTERSMDFYSLVSSIERGGPPFNGPTNVAMAADGDLFASDGYGNARVHRFSAGKELKASWGEPGGGPVEFRIPHDIVVDEHGRLLVVDRENERIQVLDSEGGHIEDWGALQRPSTLAILPDGSILVSELPYRAGERSFARGTLMEGEVGRMTVLSNSGAVQERWPSGDPYVPGHVCAPHAVTCDSQGGVYIGECPALFAAMMDLPRAGLPTLQKFFLD